MTDTGIARQENHRLLFIGQEVRNWAADVRRRNGRMADALTEFAVALEQRARPLTLAMVPANAAARDDSAIGLPNRRSKSA